MITIIKNKWKNNTRMEGTEGRISGLEKSPVQATKRRIFKMKEAQGPVTL